MKKLIMLITALTIPLLYAEEDLTTVESVVTWTREQGVVSQQTERILPPPIPRNNDDSIQKMLQAIPVVDIEIPDVPEDYYAPDTNYIPADGSEWDKGKQFEDGPVPKKTEYLVRFGSIGSESLIVRDDSVYQTSFGSIEGKSVVVRDNCNYQTSFGSISGAGEIIRDTCHSSVNFGSVAPTPRHVVMVRNHIQHYQPQREVRHIVSRPAPVRRVAYRPQPTRYCPPDPCFAQRQQIQARYHRPQPVFRPQYRQAPQQGRFCRSQHNQQRHPFHQNFLQPAFARLMGGGGGNVFQNIMH